MDQSGTSGAASDDLDALLLQLEAQLSGATAAAPPPDCTVPDMAAERRLAPRLGPDAFGREVKVAVRGAAEAVPVHLSATGILAETTHRLLPGTEVDLVLQIDGVRHLLRATIVRSVVHSPTPRPSFRTVFRFEEPTKLPERH
jgi:hypothetical protein